MRILALALVLLSGSTLSMGIGEFEERIEAATTIEGKVTLAEEGFKTIEGFVPRELFMSYWSIDVLEEIATRYESILNSKGIEGLIPEYAVISRICEMEMGDYRYFFEPLKAELDALLAQPFENSDPWSALAQKLETRPDETLSFWTVEGIHSIIELWILSGEADMSTGIDDLSQKRWSDSDIEFWDLVFSQYRLSPKRVLSAMRAKFLIGHTESFALDGLAENVDFLSWSTSEISQIRSEVSTGGPRLGLEAPTP